jgi:hypothetical protein
MRNILKSAIVGLGFILSSVQAYALNDYMGTTEYSGYGYGSVITYHRGHRVDIYKFCLAGKVDRQYKCLDGAVPRTNLLKLGDGSGRIVGTTTRGGQYHNDTMFMLTPQVDGTFTFKVIWDICFSVIGNCGYAGQATGTLEYAGMKNGFPTVKGICDGKIRGVHYYLSIFNNGTGMIAIRYFNH